MTSKQTFLVLGATGQIGGELARLLVGAGHAVRGLSRDPSKSVAADISWVKGDLERPESLIPALEGVERAFFVSTATPRLAVSAGTFIDAAKRAGVKQLVAVSSGTILIEPMPAIGLWHQAMEERLVESGLAYTILRPGAFATNSLRWATTIREQSSVFSPHAQGKTAPIDPRDIAAVAFTALTQRGHDKKTYALTGSQIVTNAEQVEKIGAAIGKPVRFVEVSEEGARKGMLSHGMPDFMADGILELIRASSRSSGFKTNTVRDVTGKEARTFDAWLADNVAAFR